ncbi:MAG: chloride channel protein [Proteobacteria bacterium]|nr:chloride channel protein [Pseudomonadota bacterium]
MRRGAALVPSFLRQFIRSREFGLTLFAALIGVIAASFVAAMGALAAGAHMVLFDLQPGERLSDVPRFDNPFVPMVGGLLLFGMTWLGARVGRTSVVDPIEANALRGGRMSFRDSALLALQTLVSNGFGASVGLEAGYTQIGSGAASRMGSWMRLRREDMRIIVASGAAGAIAAAFNGPLTGAFYAFELVLAQYAIGYVAPVMAASICATLAMHALGGAPFALQISAGRAVTEWDFPWFLLLGIACGLVGIVWMRSLPLAERLFAATRAPRMTHPIIGGLLVGELATFEPKVLSSGHGALEFELFVGMGLAAVLTLAGLKMLASTLSLGAGFRGGLFFASLLVGGLIGRAVALAVALFWPNTAPDPVAFALVGMGALAAAVIGTPLTMSFLVLETTSDYALTAAVLTASVASNLVARELFGYSFSTWRFHLRGETVRSARDVGWVRELTVARLMRTDPATAPADINIGEFRRRFPLGSRQRVVLVDAGNRVRGIVLVAQAHVEGLSDDAGAISIANTTDQALVPSMSIKDAMRAFDETESDTLIVVDTPERGQLLGTLNETYATRRYAEEMERAQPL